MKSKPDLLLFTLHSLPFTPNVMISKFKWLESSLVLWVFFLDRLSKSLVISHMLHGSAAVSPFFRLTYVENTGVAFGMFRDSNAFFIAFSSILIAALLVFRRRISGSRPDIHM